MTQERKALYVGRVETRSGSLNVRAAPGGTVIGSAASGTEVQVLDDEGEWLAIAWEDSVGYVSKRYIVFSQAAPDAHIVITDEEGHAFASAGGFALPDARPD